MSATALAFHELAPDAEGIPGTRLCCALGYFCHHYSKPWIAVASSLIMIIILSFRSQPNMSASSPKLT